MPDIHRVLLSVTDKTGLVDFARALTSLGAELISTGGTARAIREAGLPIRDVAEVTGFPEMLDGRVKTLHPKIAGGILAMRANPAHMQALAEHQIAPIDMLVVNLYRFADVASRSDAPLQELIENIDIGGPTMIRAAAKNYQDVAVVVSPDDYAGIADELRANGGGLSLETKWRLAKKAFRTTADYDAAISARLEQVDSPPPCRAISPSALPSLWTSGTARIHTSRRRFTAGQGRELPAPGNCTARNSPTTTWWISMPPGNWPRNSGHRRRPL
jgi:phosphoribosylaminoimidazolecarboxamide formyltransferase/IMP cyclohydrolase